MTKREAGLPAHHDPEGGFRNPWAEPKDRSARRVLQWMWERWSNGAPPNPLPADLPRGRPAIAYPRADPSETRITWIGHATALIQHGGLNILTDPHWSDRAAPLQWMGPARFTPPGLPFYELPPIDVVVISHDHYDHLDDGSVRRIRKFFGDEVRWFTPLGYRSWFAERGVRNLTELDWWQTAPVHIEGGYAEITALPAQHWTRRGLTQSNRLWASWAVGDDAAGRVWFGGDSGYFAGFREIGERFGPFRASLVPIGAYDPRWFMKYDHMNPEEAVQTWIDLGGQGTFLPIHWGTFRLTDEDPLEPPVRLRSAWSERGLDPTDLAIPRHGETCIVRNTR